MFIFKIIIGSLIIASVPLIATKMSSNVAGILMTIPIISLFALYLTLETGGAEVARSVASTALIALLPLALFFLTFDFALRRYSGFYALALSFIIWVFAALITLRFTEE